MIRPVPGEHSSRRDAITPSARVRRVAALWAAPGEAEGVSGRIAEHPEGILGAFVADVGYSNCSERQHFSLRSADVVDVDVEVKLLRALRVGESWRLMFGGALERQSATIGSHHDHPVAVGNLHLAAKHVGVELGQPLRVLGVQYDRAQSSDHGAGITDIGINETTYLVDGIAAIGARPAAANENLLHDGAVAARLDAVAAGNSTTMPR